jgi:predicted alpha-1,6-mannanase (GH76 family)
MDQVWVNRAVSAEAAVTGRHLKRLWGLPATQLGVVAWPPARRDRWFGGWHYWWQAHLLDCLVDAELRDPQPDRRVKIARQIRSHRLRNNGSWVNSYYDDMAWLALGLERASRIAGVQRKRALHKLNDQFVKAWVPEDGGGIPWRKQDQFFNAPANGPAGIFLTRYGDRLRRAQQMADWIDATLIDPDTHLVFDGIKSGSLVRAQYTYCQGVVLGLETELAARTHSDAGERHAARVHRLVAAVDEHMAPAGVLRGTGGGDGGLFGGVTARYLALVATTLPGESAADAAARETAREIVLSSAGGPQAEFVGGAVTGSEIAERDLSVQLSGWMLMEAAHAVTVNERDHS